MLKLKLDHTPRDVKVLTDQLVDRVNTPVQTGPYVTPFMETVLTSVNAAEAQTNIGISSFAQSLLDSSSGSDALTTLGVSDFAKSLLDDDDATAALTTLGFSDFVKSLLDEPDASTFREAIGLGGSGGVRIPKITVYKNPVVTYHTIDPETKWARVIACGGGGGGGGKSSANAGTLPRYAAGGGGGQTIVCMLDRATLDTWIGQNFIGTVNPKPANSIYVKPGNPGASGASNQTRGGQGGVSYFHHLIAAQGGRGGFFLNGTTLPELPGGGFGAGWGNTIEDTFSNSYVYAGGNGGEGGINFSGSRGGSSHFGDGGLLAFATGSGTNGGAPGSGGSGAGGTGTTTLSGGSGAPGIVIVEEYFG